MDYLAFISGLLLPWLAGAVWLAVAEAPLVRTAPAQRLRRAGYGFFLGYALLYGVMSGFSEFSGQVPYSGVMAVLAAVTAVGALLLLRGRGKYRADTHNPTAWLQDFRQLRPGTKVLLVVLLSWLALHVAFAAVEIFLRPVYPWDAWQTWIYRAKAWFLSGGMTGLVSERDWLRSGLINVYTTEGYSYPELSSAIPYWAALSLGSWSETLVNLPVLLCSVCIGLALYGQLRGLGVSLLASVLAVFLLWSTPLFGVHTALGGYADIWMAGFAGLGFMALIASARAERFSQITLGLLMLALGMLVKEEGAVWLYAALLTILIVSLPTRVLLGLLILVGILGLVGAMTGTAHVDLPLLGGAGILHNRLFIPFVGPVPLEPQDVSQAYFRNFFAMGSWNLLWVLLALALLAAWPPGNGIRRTALVFLLVFAATQLFVFGFTDRGMYAQSYTAINRLPLQFLPALVFAVTVIAWSRISRPPEIQWQRIIAAGALSALVVIGGLVILIRNDLPGETPEPMLFTPSQLRFAMGEGSRDAGGTSITGYRDGFALLSSGQVRIDADSVSLLHYSADAGGGAQSPAFFWRRQDRPGDVLRLDLPSGEGSVDLSAATGWNGQVTEVGFLFVEPGQGTARLGPFSLEPPGPTASLEAMLEGWFSFEPWSQGSVNYLYGGVRNPEYPLPLVLAAWLLLASGLALGLAWPWPRERRASWPASLVVLSLAAWVALDVRWTVNGFRQSAATCDLFAGLSPQQRLEKSMDGPLYQFIEQIKAGYLGAEPVRLVVIGGNAQGANYLVKRARYHLLPHNALIRSQLSGVHPNTAFDYVLFIDDFSGLSPQQIAARLPVDEQWRARLRGVSGNRLGILASVAPEE